MTAVTLFQHSKDFETYAAGEVIFETNQPGEKMYVVQEGEVDLLIHGKLVETLHEGGIMGEMALIEHAARVGTAVARTDCKVVPIDEKRFTFMVQQTPFFAIQVMRILAERLRKADELI